MKTAFSFVVAFCLAFVGHAHGADLSSAEAAAPRWTGPWIGVLGTGGDVGGRGGFGGLAAGYAAQFERIVVGLDGDLSGGSLDARRLGGRYEIEAFGTIRARIGYVFDRFVAFGAAGLAFASAEFARAGERDRKLQLGWTVGGGLDVALTDDLSARVEYLFVDLDRRGFDAGGPATLGPSGGLVRLGLNYRF